MLNSSSSCLGMWCKIRMELFLGVVIGFLGYHSLDTYGCNVWCSYSIYKMSNVGCSTVNDAVSNQILRPSIIWRDWFWFRCFLVQWKWMLKFILLQNQFVEANIRPVITYGLLSFLLVFLQWWCVLESSVGCFLTSTISDQSY